MGKQGLKNSKMFHVLIKIVNVIISLEKETSLSAVRIKSRTRELANISALNLVECSMIEWYFIR